MYNSGILVHVHHLETAGWLDLLWGNPETDTFGALPTLVYLLVTMPNAGYAPTIVLGCGPSRKDGFSEGEYTKRTMLAYINRLGEFSRLKPLLDALSPASNATLRRTLEDMFVTPEIKNTAAEVRTAAHIFAEQDVHTVYEICSASHAPRCIQTQAAARADGFIPSSQLWLVAATEMCFVGTVPDDTVVLEPAHRGDDAYHSLPQSLKPVVRMPAALKEQLADMVNDFVAEHPLIIRRG